MSERATLLIAWTLWLGACRRGTIEGAAPDAAPAASSAALATASGEASTAPARTGTGSAACDAALVDLLASLGAAATIRAYVTSGISEVDAALPELRATLTALTRLAPERLHAELVDAKSEDDRAAARRAGVEDVNFDGGARGLFGLVLTYRAHRDAIGRLDPRRLAQLPFAVATKLRALRDHAGGKQARFAAISDRTGVRVGAMDLAAPGTAEADRSVRSVLERTAAWYRLVDVDVSTGAIDPSFVGLVVMQPGANLSDAVLARIDDFLQLGGKSSVFFVGSAAIAPGDPAFEPAVDARGLDKLLAGYGVELSPDLVLDAQSHAIEGVETPGIVVVPAGDGAGPGLDPGFAPFAGAGPLAFPFASTLVVHGERQPDARVRVVARSPAGAQARGARGAPAAPHALAAVVEGRLRPALPAIGRTPAPATADPGRILVVASPLFLTNPFARAIAPGTPAGAGQSLGPAAKAYGERWVGPAVVTLVRTLDWMAAGAKLWSCEAHRL